MEQASGRVLPSGVEAVRQRIEQWRGTREKRSRMPEELWDAAVSVAREHGVWAVSRALRVNYETLKRRAGRGTEDRKAGAASSAGFVELDTGQLMASPERPGTVVELSGADGSRLRIRVEGRETVDVVALADAFWRRAR